MLKKSNALKKGHETLHGAQNHTHKKKAPHDLKEPSQKLD